MGVSTLAVVGPHPELAELSAADLSRMLRSGKLTSAELIQMSLERIEALDRDKTRSVIEINPDALDIARRRDREQSRGKVRGPLHGLPVLVKDNIDTGDRMLTTAGSLAMTGAPAPRDAPLVANLRRAGAVLIGKANLSEWANIRSSRSSSGWSGRGLKKDALRGKRLGVLRDPFTGYSEHTDRCYEGALAALQDCGAVLVEVEIATAKELRSSELEKTVLLHELKAGLNAYLRGRRGL